MTPAPETRIEVEAGSGSYPVLIRPGLLDRPGGLFSPFARDGRLIIVSEEQVWSAQGKRFSAGLEAAGLRPLPIVLPEGERAKSWPILVQLIDRLAELGIERTDHLIAFGGGVIGDLAGFASAILKRGCDYVQVPTSLLAQVDSSVGGKTGINIAAGKNLVGAFHQPAAVFIDPTCLASLPERHLRAGYAEILKYGLIGDRDFYSWCEASASALFAGDPDSQVHAIATSVRAKARVVAADELETTGERALLNFGHTFGHALEAATGFSDALLHGEAVALGMALATRFSARRGLCPEEDSETLSNHLRSAGLPAELSQLGLKVSGDELTEHMRHDKKARGGRVPLILTRGLGRVFVDGSVHPAEIAGFLNAELERGAVPA